MSESLTPKGTQPQPTRVTTKHRRRSYGEFLQARAEFRRARRKARALEAAKP